MATHYNLDNRIKLTADHSGDGADGLFSAGQMGTVKHVGYHPVYSRQLGKQVVNYLLYVQFDDGRLAHVPQSKVTVVETKAHV